MPRRTDIRSILVIGSGPIVIGQACEFDYSGTQACRVLRNEGFRVILVNSNPATIMTDPEFADATYIEPITPEFVEMVIAKERPDALLATLGGQTALNTAVALHENGVLERYGVELIGASIEAIQRGENREQFKAIVQGLTGISGGPAEVARSRICHSIEDVLLFMKLCRHYGVSFKATAGLHHAMRASYPLTYDPEAPVGVLFGYLNVFLAAAAVNEGAPDEVTTGILSERDASRISFDLTGARWGDFHIDYDRMMLARAAFARSFGSCSFTEPVTEARELRLV